MTRVKLYQTRVCPECGIRKPANHFGNFGICKGCRNRRQYEHQQNLIKQNTITLEEQEYLDIALNNIRSEYHGK